ncbi:MAG: hypothetical protein P8Q97_18570 [Myxococcota bacterium]|nr:hypothetical protein [Myxococcota bacterium]
MADGHDEKPNKVEAGTERGLLLSLVETLIPSSKANGAMPGASQLAEFREMPSEEAQLVYGPLLDLILDRSPQEAGENFASLDLDTREEIVRGLGADHPEVIGSAVSQTLIRYYGAEAVVEALGLEARPAHPGGYALAETNWSLLGPVRAMEPIYKPGPEREEEEG